MDEHDGSPRAGGDGSAEGPLDGSLEIHDVETLLRMWLVLFVTCLMVGGWRQAVRGVLVEVRGWLRRGMPW